MKTKNSFFTEERVSKAFKILLIILGVRCVFGLCFGLISEVASINARDELIARLDTITVFRTFSTYNFHMPSWLKDISLIELFEFGCYCYCVFIAFGYDLFHSPYPKVLPLTLFSEYFLFHLIHFSEITGANLIWLIVFIVILAAFGIYIFETPALLFALVITESAAFITSVVTCVVLPILMAYILISSIVEFIFF